MIKHWEPLAQYLRAELADYGGLLRLFDAQQRSRFNHDAEAVLRFASEIEVQARMLVDSRHRREQAVAAFAKRNCRPTTSSLRAMLPLIESDARPLLEALISEINLLLRRVRRASRHHYSMLSSTSKGGSKNTVTASAAHGDQDLVAIGQTRRRHPSARQTVGRH
jgi:hypothetical protein